MIGFGNIIASCSEGLRATSVEGEEDGSQASLNSPPRRWEVRHVATTQQEEEVGGLSEATTSLNAQVPEGWAVRPASDGCSTVPARRGGPLLSNWDEVLCLHGVHLRRPSSASMTLPSMSFMARSKSSFSLIYLLSFAFAYIYMISEFLRSNSIPPAALKKQKSNIAELKSCKKLMDVIEDTGFEAIFIATGEDCNGYACHRKTDLVGPINFTDVIESTECGHSSNNISDEGEKLPGRSNAIKRYRSYILWSFVFTVPVF
ncbi:hypothetical protein EJ110_NYTH12034 [Nymphaea thermarum]|nr:hypothetical protein EJ110_NYTH12034 [Nymphaea thermarum]